MFFIAIWIIVVAEKDEARPDKKTGMAVHYNKSWSKCIVRDHIPISFRLWKACNPSEERVAVPEREKEW